MPGQSNDKRGPSNLGSSNITHDGFYNDARCGTKTCDDWFLLKESLHNTEQDKHSLLRNPPIDQDEWDYYTTLERLTKHSLSVHPHTDAYSTQQFKNGSESVFEDAEAVLKKLDYKITSSLTTIANKSESLPEDVKSGAVLPSARTTRLSGIQGQVSSVMSLSSQHARMTAAVASAEAETARWAGHYCP